MKNLILVSTAVVFLSSCGGHKKVGPSTSSNPPVDLNLDLDPILSDVNCPVTLGSSIVFSSRKLPKGVSEHFDVTIQAQRNGSYVFQADRVTEVPSRKGKPTVVTNVYYVASTWYESHKTLVMSQGPRAIGYVEVLQMSPTPIVVLDVTSSEYLKAGLPPYVSLSLSSCGSK